MLLQKNWNENGCWFKLPRGPQPFWFLTPPVRTLLFLTLGGTCVGELQNAPWLQKKVSLFESLILVSQHADLLWLHFWKLAALGSILWPVLWFCCELASPFLIPAESVLLGLDAYSLCVYSTGDFITGPRGMDCVQCSVHVMGLCLRVYSKYWAISLPPLSKMVLLLIYFLPTFNGSFLPPSHMKEVCIEFFSSSGWRLVCGLESNFWGRFISFFSTSFGLVPSWRIWCRDQFKKEPLYFNGWNQASQIWRSKHYRLAPGLDPSNPSAHKSWCLLPLKFCNVIKENSSNQWIRASRDGGFPVTKGTEQGGLVSLINTGTLGSPS